VLHHRKCALSLLNPRATRAHQVQPDHQVNPENQAMLDHQALQEIPAKMVSQVFQARKDHQAVMENQAKTVHQATRVHQQFQHHRFQVTKDQTEIQEALVHQAHLVQTAKMVNQAAPAPKVPQALLDLKAKMAKLDLKDPKDRKAHQEKKVSVQNTALWMVVYFSKMELVVNLSKLIEFINFKNFLSKIFVLNLMHT